MITNEEIEKAATLASEKKHQKAYGLLVDGAAKDNERINKLEKENAELKEALSFYGEKEKWKQWDTDYGRDKNVLNDESDEEFIMGYGYCCGKRARATLKELEE
jgi:protein subunit release factor A